MVRSGLLSFNAIFASVRGTGLVSGTGASYNDFILGLGFRAGLDVIIYLSYTSRHI